jgi:hypothetical protein
LILLMTDVQEDKLTQDVVEQIEGAAELLAEQV